MHITTSHGRDRSSLLLLFVILTWLASMPLEARVYQRIHVDVLSSEYVTVDRKRHPIDELPAAFRARIQGDDTVLAVIYVTLPVKKALLKDVMSKCREGGAQVFSVAYKS